MTFHERHFLFFLNLALLLPTFPAVFNNLGWITDPNSANEESLYDHEEWDIEDGSMNANETHETGSENRIVGGVKAKRGRYPYYVMVQVGSEFCGGSLIARDFVLTSAHCNNGGHPELMTLFVNRYMQKQGGQKRKVVTLYEHPKFNECCTYLRNDFLLLKLDRPIDAEIPLVNLNFNPQVPEPNQKLTAIGLGTTEYRGDSPDQLQQVEIPVVPGDVCNDRYSYNNKVGTDVSFCAGTTGKDACNGDSGAPLIAAGRNALEDTVIGIVSFGFGCAGPRHPGVYARVSSAKDFIKGIVCNNTNYRPTWCPVVTTKGIQPCKDSKLRFRVHNGKKRRCRWVKRNAKAENCKAGMAAWETCPVTCKSGCAA